MTSVQQKASEQAGWDIFGTVPAAVSRALPVSVLFGPCRRRLSAPKQAPSKGHHWQGW